ncbi:glutathione S-transferase family protein [Oleiagrimonas soli]|uniref:Glutathione S-transferase n=1 Tax=Oleiagrimonas soli TaxID=1543381 RepID=A0A099CTL6_9GAMM|nr:glutathione S-transferase [Oleiagrimonas soli]KGI77109.1 glutathione S-transferase [Oleiagrimonas soli]MBB6185354.1 glutathione S-transferase [Oleiagrimonas soli]
MYTLYFAPGTAAMLTHLVLLECGVPYELKAVDLAAGEQRSDAYLALNPGGTVPTLIVDGAPHGETAALALLLTERHPEAGLAPAVGAPDRAVFLQWMFYLANTLQPGFRQWFYADEFVPDSAEAIAEAGRQRIEACWERIAAHLDNHGPHMLGETFSVVDLYVVMLMRWSRNMPRPATDWPSLAALATKVKARPSWKTLYEREQLSEWA